MLSARKLWPRRFQPSDAGGGAGCCLSPVFAWLCSVALTTSAQTLITWEDLQPPITSLQDPYAQLSIEQTYDLATLARLQVWVQENAASSDSLEVQEILRLEQRLQEQGLDVAMLLSQVDQARQYWRRQSQGINPELNGQTVKISLGMAVTLTWIGIIAIFGRQYADRYLGRQLTLRTYQMIKIAGASCVFLIGLGLFSVTFVTSGKI